MSFGKNLQHLRKLNCSMTQEANEQKEHRYAVIHIEKPFAVIPNGYKTLMEYMKINGLKQVYNDIIPCFETDGESMDIYIACE
mgnify:CR=1 FL=1